jgi:hypothetical protein
MFNIDFDKVVLWLMPEFLRKPIYFTWLKTLCSGVVALYDEFTIKRAATLYRLNHDSRVFSIEAALNDRFDSAARSIYITDGLTKNRLYIYTPNEAKPVGLGVVPLYNASDYGDTGADFIVWVPNTVSLTNQDNIELNAMVKLYKLAGKSFKIYRV